MVVAQLKDFEERRGAVRVAGRGAVDVVRIDRHQQPIELLRGAEILNVSGGGMALVSKTGMPRGSRLRVRTDQCESGQRSSSNIELEVLESSPFEGTLNRIRCKLTAGAIPAKFIYNW